VTGKQAVAVASEALEMFGGAGYIEDTGLPRLLRDAQVLPIWEGTTNVLALDALRGLGEGGVLEALVDQARQLAATAPSSGPARDAALRTIEEVAAWLREGRDLEAQARAAATALGRAFGLLLLCSQAQWSLQAEGDRRPAAAALRLSRRAGFNPWSDPDRAALANDEA